MLFRHEKEHRHYLPSSLARQSQLETQADDAPNWGTDFCCLQQHKLAVYDETLKVQWTFNIKFSAYMIFNCRLQVNTFLFLSLRRKIEGGKVFFAMI